MSKYRCIRSYAGQHRAGFGDILDEIPPGVSRSFFEPVDEAESAMLPNAPPRPVGRGLRPVTTVAGVGEKMAALLADEGITTVVDLAAAEAEKLAQVKGISKTTGARLIKAAREALK